MKLERRVEKLEGRRGDDVPLVRFLYDEKGKWCGLKVILPEEVKEEEKIQE